MESPESPARRATWRRLLEGDLAQRAFEAVGAIAEDLERAHSQGLGLEGTYSRSLAFGHAGIALFYAYLSGSAVEPFPRPRALAGAFRFLDDALEALSTRRMVPDLSRGIAGIGWVHEHLKGRLWQPEPEDDDACIEIDDALYEWCDRPSVPLDLMEGLAGVCLYAAERPPCASAERLMRRAVDRLVELAESPADGHRTWRAPLWIATLLSRNEQLGPQEEMEQRLRQGVFKIGAAHGAAGMLACIAAGLPRLARADRIARLQREVFDWVWDHRLPDESATMFPEFVGVEMKQLTTGWCNGDIGVAVALLTAARAFGSKEGEARALEVARRVSRLRLVDVEFFNRANPGLCHGSGGRAHLLNRLYQLTGDEAFAEAARFWFGHALGLSGPGQGTGGFTVDEPTNGGRKNIRGFLMGAAGLGLALLAAIGEEEPCWDRLLLASC
jgi:hypothetical protein